MLAAFRPKHIIGILEAAMKKKLLLTAVFLTILALAPMRQGSADLKISELKGSFLENFKLIFKEKHAGWMSITGKITASNLEYVQKMEIASFKEEIIIKTRGDALISIVVKSKQGKESSKFVAVLEDSPKKFKGKYGRKKREYELTNANCLPIRAVRFLAIPGIAWDEAGKQR